MNSIDYHFTVNWRDTDAAGIVFYPNFYKWMDQSTHHFLDKIGYKVSTLFFEKKITQPLLEAKCEFKSPLLFEDVVRVRTTVKELRDKVFILDHEFLKNDKQVAKGYEIRAWTDFGNGKPKAVTIPEDVRQAMSVIKAKV